MLLVQSFVILLTCSNSRQMIHIHVPLFTKQYKLVPAKGLWCFEAKKVLIYLAENNGWLMLGFVSYEPSIGTVGDLCLYLAWSVRLQGIIHIAAVVGYLLLQSQDSGSTASSLCVWSQVQSTAMCRPWLLCYFELRPPLRPSFTRK